MSNLDTTQAELVAYFKTISGFKWHEQALVDGETVKKVAGEIEPYFAYNFGPIYNSGTYNMGNVRADDYSFSVEVQCIAPTPTLARQMANTVSSSALGKSFTHSGLLRPRLGGAIGVVTASNGATEAYNAAIGFTLPIDMVEHSV